MLPWSFTEEGAAERLWPNFNTTCGSPTPRLSVLSIITSGGKWVEITLPADSLYQHLLLTASRSLAVRGERRAPSPLRCRAAPTTHGGRPDCRYGGFQFVG